MTNGVFVGLTVAQLVRNDSVESANQLLHRTCSSHFSASKATALKITLKLSIATACHRQTGRTYQVSSLQVACRQMLTGKARLTMIRRRRTDL